MKRITLWIITEKEDGYEVRQELLGATKIEREEPKLHDTLREARNCVPRGLLRLDSYPHPALECWVGSV